MWIDDDGLTRRFTIELAAGGAHVSESIDITDYGVAVDVSAPPASETMDLSELTDLAGSLAS